MTVIPVWAMITVSMESVSLVRRLFLAMTAMYARTTVAWKEWDARLRRTLLTAMTAVCARSMKDAWAEHVHQVSKTFLATMEIRAPTMVVMLLEGVSQ